MYVKQLHGVSHTLAKVRGRILRLVVVSDTHDRIDIIERMFNTIREIENIAAIVHLGDLVSPFTLAYMLKYPYKLLVVLGNNDGDKTTLKELGLRGGAIVRDHVYEFTIGGRRILAVHGFYSKEITRNIVYAIARGGQYDVVLYGHTHEVDVTRINTTLVLNPGELCGYLTGRSTFAVIDLESLNVEVVDLK